MTTIARDDWPTKGVFCKMTYKMFLNKDTWYSVRRLDFTPDHFIRSTTRLVEVDALAWIYESCTGRFSIRTDISGYNYPCFENPKEAMMYELKWG